MNDSKNRRSYTGPLPISFILILMAAFAFAVISCSEKKCSVQKVEMVDHSSFDTILKACVRSDGMVDYQLLEQSYSDVLEHYLNYLGSIDVLQLERDSQKLAFWINAYNALCLKQVLTHTAKKSVYLENPLFFKRQEYFIAGRKRSLDEIRDQIIRPVFNEPRAFSALCDAAISSPPLRSEVYLPKKLAAQLDNQCRIWIASKRHNYLDRETNCLYLSALFKNFAQDFDLLYDNPRGFFLKYARPDDRKYLQEHDVAILYLPYDWSLNRTD